MSIAAAYGGTDMGPESRRGTRPSEIITITGATGAVGDTAAGYRLRHVRKNPQILGGAFAIAASATDLGGVSIDIEARVALANRAVQVEVIGDI